MTTRLPILNYHGIGGCADKLLTDAERPYVLPRLRFEEQLDLIQDRGFSTLSLVELQQWLRGGEVFQKPLVLTFDDGLSSHFGIVAPALKKRKMKGIFFIPAGLVGQRGQMDWSQLRELAAEGFEMGSHGLNHIPLSHLSEERVREELKDSKELLQIRGGDEIWSFSVPKGYFHTKIRVLAREVGYRMVFTSQFDLNPRGQDLLCLNRLVIKKDLDLHAFARTIEGRLGLKKYSERAKAAARAFLAPALYDAASTAKRKLRWESF